MRIIKNLPDLRRRIRALRKRNHSIGFVPTMGALHEGHLSLIRAARKENDFVIVSVFVNPLQFNQRKDFTEYPRILARDARIAGLAGADLIFAPAASDLYPADFQTSVTADRLSRRWEGAYRPGHFRGVTTVVAKLFNLVQPDTAYFGQKDAQQARIIQQMVRDLNMDLRVKVLPTVREPDGLAMSSRNRRLSAAQRHSAAVLSRALQEGKGLLEWNSRRTAPALRRMKQIVRRVPGVRLEYLAVVDPENLEPVSQVQKSALVLIAAWVGSVRLIDCCRIVPRFRKGF